MKSENKFKCIFSMTLALLLIFNLPARVFGWGKDGHVIIAHIASRMLTPKAAAQVGNLLKSEETLEKVAAWADEVRGNHNNPGRAETPRWHFVDIPLKANNYDSLRDCAETPNGSCAVSALVIFQDVLSGLKKGYYSESFNRYEALKFIVHFAGDIHQPLHCVDDDDAGGNFKNVYFLDNKRNLHHVWDDDILLENMKAQNINDDIAYADYLYKNLNPDQIKLAAPKTSTNPTVIERAAIEVWAKDSHALAQRAYADIGKRDSDGYYHLEQAYYDKYKLEVNKQLATAGIRLARILNENLR